MKVLDLVREKLKNSISRQILSLAQKTLEKLQCLDNEIQKQGKELGELREELRHEHRKASEFIPLPTTFPANLQTASTINEATSPIGERKLQDLSLTELRSITMEELAKAAGESKRALRAFQGRLEEADRISGVPLDSLERARIARLLSTPPSPPEEIRLSAPNLQACAYARASMLLTMEEKRKELENKGFKVLYPLPLELYAEDVHEVISLYPTEDESLIRKIESTQEPGYQITGEPTVKARVTVYKRRGQDG